MKKQFLLAFVALIGVVSATAQEKYFTKSGKISFYSKSSLENIEAHNKSVTCVLDTKTGNLQFAILMKGFEFEKALMQEHFNENYVESHKFPKADFKGQVTNNAMIDYAKDGSYPVTVKGKLSLHGESKEVETTGTVIIRGGKIDARAGFNVQLADYKITVPNLVKDNISKTINIAVDCQLEPLKN